MLYNHYWDAPYTALSAGLVLSCPGVLTVIAECIRIM